MTKRILLVENEKNLARFIDLELQKAGYVVDLVEQGEMALKLLQATEYDLILLNYELEDMRGEEFAQRLSKIRPAAVLIVLDSREKISEHMEKIVAIFRGRDFIDQHCNQMKVPTSYRNLRIDVENHMVYRGEEVIDLTRREYDLLATLMGSKHVLSREQLLERVWKYESTAETNIVDVYIRYLRGKIDLPGQKSYIKTVRGVGYQMQE